MLQIVLKVEGVGAWLALGTMVIFIVAGLLMAVIIRRRAAIGVNDPAQHWEGMPEFRQRKLRPYSQITVRFETEEDMNEFAEMIGQKLTKKTKSIWHPQMIRGKDAKKRWIDVSDAE